MKKSHTPISDVKNESSDLTKRLYRSIGDVVRSLDQEKQKANSIPDLFKQNSEAQRMKLRDYCERLMFFDPVGFGRRGEELLWRKGYYEVVTYAKRLHKGPLWKPMELSHLRNHLQAGIGHYHHLLLRLQLDFKLDLRGAVDFPLLVNDDGLKKGKSGSNSKEKPLDTGAVEWANAAVHHCLIYLGDLGRYLADLCPGYNIDLPVRYYHQALYWNSECGMPHNQLGTLVGSQNYHLDSAYHYMRCLASAQSFEGTESNLAGVLERSHKHYESTMTPAPLHHLMAKFLSIVEFCYFQKQPLECFPQVCHEAIDRLNSCEEMLQSVKAVNDEDLYTQSDKLSDDILFKLTLVSIMCTHHLQNRGSEQMGIALAVTLATMNYLILKAVERMEAVLPTPQPPPPPVAVNGHSKHRRRLRRRRHSPDLSDLSDEGEVITVSSDSDMSEEELVFDVHSSDNESEPEADEEKKDENELDPRKVQLGDTPVLAKSTVLDHVEHLCQEGFLLQTIKVCLDWLLNNTRVLKACAHSAKPMLNRMSTLLNHFTLVPLPHVAAEQPHDNNGFLENEQIPLVEEVSVRGLTALKPVYQHLDWAQLKKKSLTPRQEAYVRVCKLLKAGRKLASSEDTEITYDEEKKWFQLTTVESDNYVPQVLQPETKVAAEEKGRLMKDMGQLWLKAEVRELESKVRRPSPLPPYLVLDCDALAYHIALVKQLVYSKKFIVLVPSVVVSALDEQKRISRKVRETIRWLEAQFRQGNRFLRAQRANEHLPLPLIKYPKKKDKEAWMFFQVAECCHFISQQSGTRTEKDSLVTLLTGSRTLLEPNTNNGFSPLGIANTAGISIEHIETFHGKWKISSKSHG